MTGPDSGTEREARRAREAGAARAVRRRRRVDVSRAVGVAVERARSEARPHDCTIEVRAGSLLRLLLPTRRVPGWSLGTVQLAGTESDSRGAVANFALGSDGRLYWNAELPESGGIGSDGRFATTGAYASRRPSDELEVLDGVMGLLEGAGQPPPDSD